MFDKCFSFVYSVARKWKWPIIGVILLLTILATLNLKTLTFDNNIESMLPDDENIKRSISFLRESNFSDKVVLSVKLEDSEKGTQDLIDVVDVLSRSLESPLIEDVFVGVNEVNAMDSAGLVVEYYPQLFDETALSQINERILPEKIQASLKGIYKQSLSPGSAFMLPFLRRDPLGLTQGVFNYIRELSSSFGYRLQIVDGHCISEDGRHALIVIETSVNISDGFGARRLMKYLDEKISELPEYVSVSIIAGHRHTLSNEDVIKRDIKLTATIASIGFILLFICVFRDFKAITIFLVPLVSILISINISAFFMHKLSYFIVGMGAVVAGIAIDYGIHIYVAVRIAGSSVDGIEKVAKPSIVGALTTISVFLAFFFSSVKGYHQLALFSILSIMLCLLLALVVLPQFFSKGPGSMPLDKGRDERAEHLAFRDVVFLVVWLVVVTLGILSFGRVNFDNDIRNFDGSAPSVFQDEDDFHEVWGGENRPAILVAPGRTLTETLELNEAVFEKSRNIIADGDFLNIAKIWPSKTSRRENLVRWRDFWTNEKQDDVKTIFQEEGAKYNFSSNAFDPFFNSLEIGKIEPIDPNDLLLIEPIKERFIVESDRGYQALSFFPDTEENIETVSEITEDYPGTFIVSRKAISGILSKSISSEIVYLAFIAMILIAALTLLLLRSIPLALLALVPVVTAIAGIVGVITLFGASLNAPSVIAAMVVVGLSIDYGIFMVYTCRYKIKLGTRKAVTLSAVTTIIGAGVLLFAIHPVLFSIGRTLVVGVGCGYLSSIIVIPRLFRLFSAKDKELITTCVV